MLDNGQTAPKWAPPELTATGAVERDEHNPARRRWTGRVSQQNLAVNGGFVHCRRLGNLLESAAGELDFDASAPSLFRSKGKSLVGSAGWTLYDLAKYPAKIPLLRVGDTIFTPGVDDLCAEQRYETPTAPPIPTVVLTVEWIVGAHGQVKQLLRLFSANGGSYRLAMRLNGVPNQFVMEQPVDAGGLRTILTLDDLRISLSPAETALLPANDAPRLIAPNQAQLAFDVTVPAGQTVVLDPTFNQQIAASNHDARWDHTNSLWNTTGSNGFGRDLPGPYYTSYVLFDLPDMSGTTITTTALTYVPSQGKAGAFNVPATVKALAQNCPELTTNRSGNTKGAVSVNYTPPAWVANVSQTITGLAAVAQEWVNSGYGNGGGGLCLVVGNVTTGLDTDDVRWAYSWDTSAAKAPRITIDYTVPSGYVRHGRLGGLLDGELGGELQ